METCLILLKDNGHISKKEWDIILEKLHIKNNFTLINHLLLRKYWTCSRSAKKDYPLFMVLLPRLNWFAELNSELPGIKKLSQHYIEWRKLFKYWPRKRWWWKVLKRDTRATAYWRISNFLPHDHIWSKVRGFKRESNECIRNEKTESWFRSKL